MSTLGYRLELLWADDQRNVAEGLARNLGSTLARTTFCESGTAALEQLAKRYFDLVILDLAMPPGRWGGLSVLERLREQKTRVPVLILSGEGTQTETIQAMRLGAQDYVLKEHADSELRTAVENTTAKYWSATIGNAQTHLPAPLALPVSLYVTAEGSVNRLKRLIEYFEALTRFCVILLASSRECRKVLLQVPGFARPSFGTWNELRRRLLNVNDPHRHLDRQVTSAIDDTTIADVISIRNDFAHAGEISSADCDVYLRKFGSSFDRSLRILSQRLTGMLVHITSLRFLAGSFEITGRELCGIEPSFKPHQSTGAEPIECNCTYWCDGGYYRNVEPLLLSRIMNDSWRIYIYDGYKTSKQGAPDSTGEIRYVEILSRKRHEAVGGYKMSNLAS